MKKKITLTLLALICALCCALGLAACNNGDGNNGGGGGNNGDGDNSDLEYTLKDDDTYSVKAKSIEGDVLIGDGVIIGKQLQITIPAEHNGKAVTEIDDYAFSHRNLIGITIPDSVTIIGADAFSGCPLTSITIPNSVTNIGGGAFRNCNSLTTMTIPFVGGNEDAEDQSNEARLYYLFGWRDYVPQSLSTIILTGGWHIGNFAFEGCSNLTSITMADSITTVRDLAFAYTLTLSGENPEYPIYCPIENATVPALALKNLPKTKLTNLTVTSGEIDAAVLESCNDLTNITIGGGVTAIKQNAFANCTKLKKVTIENKDTTIATGAFENCPIETATVPASAISYIKNAALKNVKITNSDGLTATAFDGCDNMVYNEYDNAYYLGSEDNAYAYLIKAKDKTIMSCNIHENTEFIANLAFSGCAGIESLTIPRKVTAIGNNSLRSCNFLAVYCEVAAKPEKWDDEWNKCDNDYSYPVIWNCKNNDKDINGYSYAVIDNLRYALKDSTATVVRQPAYIQTATIPATVSNGGTTYNVTAIGNNAFYGCALLTSLTIADSVKSIGNYAFFHCAFTGITLPNELTNIGDCAFQYCENLTNITIPSTVKTIGKGAFGFCNKLESVTIPSGVENIGEITFYACTSLTEITIPESVTGIGAYAFSGCSALTTITFNGTTTQWSAITKGDSWNVATGNYTIHCNGGDIAKEN